MALARRFRNELSNLPSTIRIAPEYRRSLAYVAVGIVVETILIYVLRGPFSPRKTIALALVGVVGLAGFAWPCLFWKLLVDVDGLHVRRLPFVWDRWPWDEFASGHVAEAEGCAAFVRAEASWPYAKLDLTYLRAQDREWIEGLVEQVWVKPKIDISHELEFQMNPWLRVRMQTDGVQVTKGRNIHWRNWREVEELVLHRRNDRRRGFEKLDLRFPGLKVQLGITHDNRSSFESWSGVGGKKRPSAEAIAAFLERYVPPDRQVVVIGEEASLKALTYEQQLEKARRYQKEILQCWWFIGACSVALIGATLWGREGTNSGKLYFLLFTLIFIGVVNGLIWYRYRASRSAFTKLESADPRLKRSGRAEAGLLKRSSGQVQARPDTVSR